jgi:hypothetical protein
MHLEVSGAVRHIYMTLDGNGLMTANLKETAKNKAWFEVAQHTI